MKGFESTVQPVCGSVAYLILRIAKNNHAKFCSTAFQRSLFTWYVHSVLSSTKLKRIKGRGNKSKIDYKK